MNLLACCRKCNRTRGNMPFAEWLRSRKFLDAARRLSQAEHDALHALARTLVDIPRRVHEKKR